MSARYVLALDEGSSSARAVLVDADGQVVGEARNALEPLFPNPGWIELDPQAVWRAQQHSIATVLDEADVRPRDIAAVGITTHRETALIWDRSTGQPVHNAVMWSSKQTDDIVARWQAEGLHDEMKARAGVPNDSFFTAGKLAWLLEHVDGVRERAERGELAAGTIDTWLLWNLTGGASHRTDHGEASRTALFNLAELAWDEELCAACGIPMELLAPAVASSSDFGVVDPDVLGTSQHIEVPVTAILADQQSSLFGHACFEEGTAKSTYGTAGVLVANCGDSPGEVPGLTTSAAWTVGDWTAYEVEGVVFHCGQTVQWLRDSLGLFDDGDDIEQIVRSVDDNGGVYVVPGFTGMCAPHWRRDVSASIVGLTLASEPAHIVRAGVEAMAFQTADNVAALADGGVDLDILLVDGGAAVNDHLCQLQADLCGVEVARPTELERTALGVAFLAGGGVDLWDATQMATDTWRTDRTFEPQMPDDERDALLAGWQEAVDSVLLTGDGPDGGS